MTIFWSPSGSLNVSTDASDLPESRSARDSVTSLDTTSEAMVRCKNLRTNEPGKSQTRDGSAKLNTTAMEPEVWWIEEQGGVRYSFAGTQIYQDESSIATGLTLAQWSAIKYNSFNDSVQNIYAMNGTDRKRITGGVVYEWGIAAPTVAPTLLRGYGTGLTGVYNVKYTYARKVGDTLIAESNGSPAATVDKLLADGSLLVDVDESPSDTQITHIKLYRTLANGTEYFLDQEIPVGNTWAYGYTWAWEKTDAYIAGTGYKYTVTDVGHTTENTYTWELSYEELTEDEDPTKQDDPVDNYDDYDEYDWTLEEVEG